MRKIGISQAEFDASKNLEETDQNLIVKNVVLAREGVFPYADGKAYKPAAELKDAAWTLEGTWIVALNHADTVFVTNKADIRGKPENVRFCEKINGILGDLKFFKDHCDQAFLDGVKSGKLKDVSLAFFSDDDFTPGKFGDQAYDFVQRNFMFGHVAAGVPEGRCPSPFCGMALDSVVIRPHTDPEVTANYVRIRVQDPNLFVEGSFRTIVLSAKEGIHAIIGKLKSDPSGSTVVQNYMFERAKGWTMEKAQAWVSQHKDEFFDAQWTTQFIDNLPDGCFAYIESGGKKDADGKTVPRSLRHLPYENADGSIDHDHLVNALARVSQPGTLPGGGKAEALSNLCGAVKDWNREHSDKKIMSDVCKTQPNSASDSCVVANPVAELERSRELLSR